MAQFSGGDCNGIKAAVIAAIFVLLSTAAEARPSPSTIDDWRRSDTRYDWSYSTEAAPKRQRLRVAKAKKHKTRKIKEQRHIARHHRPSRAIVAETTTILPHPPGCPARSFCGCGVALHIFGKPIRELWLAANWFRFPRATPAGGMVAVRRGHVFAILRPLGDGTVLAYDPNSGGHKTRIHRRSLAGYTVVNPHGSKYAGMGS